MCSLSADLQQFAFGRQPSVEMQQKEQSADYAAELHSLAYILIASDIIAGNTPHEASGYLYFVKPYE